MKKNSTLDYYNKNADSFTAGTIDVEFTVTQDRFLSLLPAGAYILDFGCGSGRDARYFLSKGYKVDPIDGSAELCKIAAKTTGVPVRQMLFTELEEVDKYDGIWACSSILHLPKKELSDVLRRMMRAVKDGGYLYASFKYGEFEGYRNERHFTDFTEETFRDFIKDIPGVEILEEWVSADVRPGRGEEKWLNLILWKK